MSLSKIVNGAQQMGMALYLLLSTTIIWDLFGEMILYIYFILIVKMRMAVSRVLVQQFF